MTLERDAEMNQASRLCRNVKWVLCFIMKLGNIAIHSHADTDIRCTSSLLAFLHLQPHSEERKKKGEK